MGNEINILLLGNIPYLSSTHFTPTMLQYFIHPQLRDPGHKDYKKSLIYTWAMLVIGIFLIPYGIYFWLRYPDDTIKNLTNLVFTSLFLFGMLLGRLSSNFKNVTIFIAAISYPPIMISVYHTGGIYSVDIIWLFICLCTQCIFLDYRIGIVAAVAVTFFYIYLYYADSGGALANNTFKGYILSHNSTHNLFTLIFVTFLIVALLSTFSRTLAITNKKLEELSREKIDTLEQRLLEKTNELSQVRQTLAKDFHDEMGNKLASISLLSQSVGLKISEETSPEEIGRLLSTIEKRSRELYEGTKDFIWSIDLKSDYIEELFIYLRDFGEVFFEPLEISFYSSYQAPGSTYARLPATAGRQMVYVCKELMTNAAKHSECTELYFAVEIREHTMTIALSDNGKGFVSGDVTRRGLRNIEQRIRNIKGEYHLSSSSMGTFYMITLPVEKQTLAISGSTGKATIL